MKEYLLGTVIALVWIVGILICIGVILRRGKRGKYKKNGF